MWNLTGTIGGAAVDDIDDWSALLGLVCMEAAERLSTASAQTVFDLLSGLEPRPEFVLAAADIYIHIKELTNA